MSQLKDQHIVDDHRNMLMVSKKISKFQEANLQSWAFLFFDKLDKLEVNWNFIRKNKNRDFYPGKITFDLKFPKDHNIDDETAQLAIDRLTACTKFLFWSETEVIVKKSGKKWTIEKNNLQNQSSTTSQKKS